MDCTILLRLTTWICLLNRSLGLYLQSKFSEVSLIRKVSGIVNKDFGRVFKKLPLFVPAARQEEVETNLHPVFQDISISCVCLNHHTLHWQEYTNKSWMDFSRSISSMKILKNPLTPLWMRQYKFIHCWKKKSSQFLPNFTILSIFEMFLKFAKDYSKPKNQLSETLSHWENFGSMKFPESLKIGLIQLRTINGSAIKFMIYYKWTLEWEVETKKYISLIFWNWIPMSTRNCQTSRKSRIHLSSSRRTIIQIVMLNWIWYSLRKQSKIFWKYKGFYLWQEVTPFWLEFRAVGNSPWPG